MACMHLKFVKSNLTSGLCPRVSSWLDFLVEGTASGWPASTLRQAALTAVLPKPRHDMQPTLRLH